MTLRTKLAHWLLKESSKPASPPAAPATRSKQRIVTSKPHNGIPCAGDLDGEIR